MRDEVDAIDRIQELKRMRQGGQTFDFPEAKEAASFKALPQDAANRG